MAKENMTANEDLQTPVAKATEPVKEDVTASDGIISRNAFAWQNEGETDTQKEGVETVYTVPIDLQRSRFVRNGMEYDNFAVGCSFPTDKKSPDGQPQFLDVDFKVVPVETKTPVLYNLLKLIYGDESSKKLSIVKTTRTGSDGKPTSTYSMRVIEKDGAIGDIFCDMRPQSTGDRVMFNVLVSALKQRGYIK